MLIFRCLIRLHVKLAKWKQARTRKDLIKIIHLSLTRLESSVGRAERLKLMKRRILVWHLWLLELAKVSYIATAKAMLAVVPMWFKQLMCYSYGLSRAAHTYHLSHLFKIAPLLKFHITKLSKLFSNESNLAIRRPFQILSCHRLVNGTTFALFNLPFIPQGWNAHMW